MDSTTNGTTLARMSETLVVVDTSLGAFTIALDAARAPKSVANFLGYVDAKHYDGTIFHRVIDGFMIQGGGFDQTMNKRPTRQFRGEGRFFDRFFRCSCRRLQFWKFELQPDRNDRQQQGDRGDCKRELRADTIP